MEGAGEVFSYNREGFMFDREQNQKREYQGQNMRIAQYEMYRQDVDDLVNLTVSKMDNYLLVNTLMFNFCIVLLTEGRPKAIAPPEWLLWLYGMTTMGAILYIVMGMWLALHASVAAHSFGARILTQCVRLPVPNKQQLDAARFFATEYEAGDVIGLQQGMLRLPLLERLNNAMEELIDTGEAQEPNSSHPNSAGMLEHFRIFRRLQANWQAYDAYTRVCMSAGVNQLIHAFIYSTLVILVTEASSPLPALCFALVLASCSWLVTRLDLFLSRRMLALVGTFVAIPPVLAWAAITIQTCGFTEMHDAGCQKRSPRYLVDLRRVLVPVIYVLHIGWIVLIIRFGRAQQIGEVALPTAFRSVLYLDVSSGLGLPSHESRQGSAAPSRQVSAAEASSVPMGVAVSRSSTARHLLDAVPEEPEVAEREPETLLGELESQVMARTSTRRRRQLSSGDSTTRSVSPHRSIRPPDAVRSSLEESCERQLAELRRHLECWETEAVQACIREDSRDTQGQTFCADAE
ncbi:unnamed protein product [Prorocentrum cordatum]|uniref:Autophagy-related protein 9 n=1 Tax=Prorocentrum cordatum TaxID=2364126 RepID=A0ABN9X2N5_9DINO|nr:unnamed protein product [Polarella glacialis]